MQTLHDIVHVFFEKFTFTCYIHVVPTRLRVEDVDVYACIPIEI